MGNILNLNEQKWKMVNNNTTTTTTNNNNNNNINN